MSTQINETTFSTTNVQILIEKVDIVNDQIIFKPYSTNFKKDITEYESFAANISNLAPGSLVDQESIKRALIQISQPYIRTTLYKESLEDDASQAALQELKKLENTTIGTTFFDLPKTNSTSLSGDAFDIVV